MTLPAARWFSWKPERTCGEILGEEMNRAEPTLGFVGFQASAEFRISLDPRLETRNSKPRAKRRLHRVFWPLVFGSTHTLFDRGVGDREDRQRDQPYDRWKQQPFSAVGGGGDPQIVLGDFAERQSEN